MVILHKPHLGSGWKLPNLGTSSKIRIEIAEIHPDKNRNFQRFLDQASKGIFGGPSNTQFIAAVVGILVVHVKLRRIRKGLVSMVEQFVPQFTIVLHLFARCQNCAGQTRNTIIGSILPESSKFLHRQVTAGTHPKKPVRKVTEFRLSYSTFTLSTSKALLRLASIIISPHHSKALQRTTRKLKKTTSHQDSKVLSGDVGEFGVRRVEDNEL